MIYFFSLNTKMYQFPSTSFMSLYMLESQYSFSGRIFILIVLDLISFIFMSLIKSEFWYYNSRTHSWENLIQPQYFSYIFSLSFSYMFMWVIIHIMYYGVIIHIFNHTLYFVKTHIECEQRDWRDITVVIL